MFKKIAVFACAALFAGSALARADEAIQWNAYSEIIGVIDDSAIVDGVPVSDYIFKIMRQGQQVAELKVDGSMTFADGATPQAAADLYSDSFGGGFETIGAEHETICAEHVPMAYTLSLAGYDTRVNPPKMIQIGLRPDGTVEYSGFTPSSQEAEFFAILAKRFACPPK
jgi:hypothetical protein